MIIDKFPSKDKISELIKSNILLMLLVIIVFVLWIINIKYQTYFIGWDNLQVELGYWLNLKRNIHSAWQEYQGLGLPAGHAHAVESIRLILFAPLYLIFPEWMFRYSFHFTMHLVGVVSMFYLLQNYILPKRDKTFAFIGALFYMLNWATVQIFYAALEPFSAFYAFLPLTIFLIYKYYRKSSAGNYLYLLFGFLLLTISFQIQTFFVVYFIIVVIPLSFYLLYQLFRKHIGNAKKVFLILLSFSLINLYWLGNVIYFTLSGSNVRFESKTNRMASYESFLRNVEYSNFLDVFQLKSFWLSNTDYFTELKAFGFMLESWLEWMDHSVINFISLLIAVFVIFGLFCLIIFYRQKAKYLLVYISFISLFFIFNIKGPFGYLYQNTILQIDILAEIFRFPFTKWGAATSFTFSILLSIGLFYLHVIFSKYIKYRSEIFKYVLITLFSILIFVYSLPSFKGDFLYKYLRQDLPKEYKLLFEFMEDQPKSKRIADLPQPNFWGWYFNDWGYRGSGFIWYGIEQPITSRTFDVWNIKNERFYDEFQYAIYSGNPLLLKYVLNKYQIDYLIYDKTELVPGSPNATYEEETISLLKTIPQIQITEDWGNLVIFKVELDDNINEFVYTPEEFSVTNNYSFTNVDSFFTKADHNYIGKDNNIIIHPFNDDGYLSKSISNENLLINKPKFENSVLYTRNRGREIYPIHIEKSDRQLKIDLAKPQITDSINNVVFPTNDNDIYLDWNDDYDIYVDNKIINDINKANLIVFDESHIIGAEKEPTTTINYSDKIFSANVSDCSGGVTNFAKIYDKYHGSIIINSSFGGTCLNFVETIENNDLNIYKIEFESKNTENAFPVYCLFDKQSKQCLNDKYYSAPNKNELYTSYVDYVFVDKNTELSFHLAVETYDISENKIGNAAFKDIKVTQYPVLEAVSFNDLFTKYTEDGYERIILDSEQFPLLVTLDEFAAFSKSYIPNENNEDFNKSVNNCSNFTDGDYSREYLNDSYTYKSTNAISCDTIDSRYPNPRADYLFTINADNIKGKPLNICVAGTAIDRCIIEDKLNPKLEEQSFILPRYKIYGSYMTNYYNESLADIESVNTVNGIRYSLIPYDWFKDLSIANSDFELKTKNNIKLIESNKKNYFTYNVSVSSVELESNNTDGFLVLNQSYEDGWKIYNVNDCILGVKTPITCKNSSNYEHVLAKNWANGWILPNEDAKYVIIFWPQYLQFFGYLMLFLTFLGLILYITYKKHSPYTKELPTI